MTDVRAPGNWGGADLASTPAELAAAVRVAVGRRAEVWVEATGDVADAELAAAVRGSGGYAVAHAFDARLFASVDGVVSELHELAVPVRVRIALPEGVPDAAPGMVRSWAVVCVHDGGVTLLGADCDAAAGTLTFETDRFSTFAVAYRDVPAAPVAETAAQPAASLPPAQANVAPARLAQTGDPNDRRSAASLALVGAILLTGGLVIADRRRLAFRHRKGRTSVER